MEWLVVDSVSCPVTGTTFTFIIRTDNKKLILWYQGGAVPPNGEAVWIDSRNRMLISQKGAAQTILATNHFSPYIWKSIQKYAHCPGDEKVRPQICTWGKRCIFDHCPYHLHNPASHSS